MALFITILLFVVGLVLIIKGGDFFVDAATWMAEASGIPKFLIGATVVSFATTLPELLVSLIAVAEGKVDMSVGNAVGSVTANLGLIMAIALVCMPMAIKRRDYMLKSLLMLAASAIVVVCGYIGSVGILPSIGLLAIFVTAMIDNITEARTALAGGGTAGEEKPKQDKKVVATNLLKFLLGAVGIVVGAQLLVDNGSELAYLVGVPERIIGVTFIAIGTSLPELVTTITAIRKKQGALSIGNIIGANIIDLTLILPLCSIVGGQALPISAASAMIDLPACLIIGMVGLVPTLITKRFTRIQGIVLLVLYSVYALITAGIIG